MIRDRGGRGAQVLLAGSCLGALFIVGCTAQKPRGSCVSGISCFEDVHSGECEILNGSFRVGVTCSGEPLPSNDITGPTNSSWEAWMRSLTPAPTSPSPYRHPPRHPMLLASGWPANDAVTTFKEWRAFVEARPGGDQGYLPGRGERRRHPPLPNGCGLRRLP